MAPSGLELVCSSDPSASDSRRLGPGCELTVNDLADGAILIQVVVISLRRPGYLGKRFSLSCLCLLFLSKEYYFSKLANLVKFYPFFRIHSFPFSFHLLKQGLTNPKLALNSLCS